MRIETSHLQAGQTQPGLIDIIIPVYNTPKAYLDRCLESIDLTDARVQVLLVDDGSDNETAAYLDGLADRHPSHVAVYHQENGGQSSARLCGFRHATARYVTFLDSDDWLDWGEFAQVLQLANDHAPSILSFDYTVTDGVQGEEHKKGLTGECALVKAYDYVADRMTLWATLYRRDIISAEDFCVGPVMGEDIATAIPLALRVGEVATTAHDAYRYFQHDQSMTNKPSPRAVTDMVGSFSFMMERTDLSDPNVYETMEWLAILHVLYYASIRCVEWFGPREDVKHLFSDYVNEHFPRWRKNPRLRSEDIAKSPSFRLLTRGMWRLYARVRHIPKNGLAVQPILHTVN